LHNGTGRTPVRKFSIGLLCLLAGCAQPLVFDAALTTLPYTVDPSGRIVIDIRINGQGPFQFAIDTAATSSFAFSRMTDSLGLEPLPGVTSLVYGAVATGSFPVIAIDRLQIGEATWADAQLTALPGTTSATSRLDGILGADFLRRYTVAFSVQNTTIYLYDPAVIGNRTYRGWNSIDTVPRRFGDSPEPLRYVEIDLKGRTLPALVDLGSGSSILNPPAARIWRLTTVRAAEQAEFSGAVGSQPVIARLSTQRVRTGAISWRNESFVIADLEIFETLRTEETPLAILGSGLFNQRDFILDFNHERILVRGSMDEVEPAT
jgi:predicted aspartyl protease